MDDTDLIDKVAAARKAAYATAARTSNDHLEAAMFVAMMKAGLDFLGISPVAVAGVSEEVVEEPSTEPAGATEPPVETVTEDELHD